MVETLEVPTKIAALLEKLKKWVPKENDCPIRVLRIINATVGAWTLEEKEEMSKWVKKEAGTLRFSIFLEHYLRTKNQAS